MLETPQNKMVDNSPVQKDRDPKYDFDVLEYVDDFETFGENYDDRIKVRRYTVTTRYGTLHINGTNKHPMNRQMMADIVRKAIDGLKA